MLVKNSDCCVRSPSPAPQHPWGRSIRRERGRLLFNVRCSFLRRCGGCRSDKGELSSALETVIDLLRYAKKVYLITRSGKLKGDPVDHEKVSESPKVQVIKSAEIKEIFGNQSVTGLQYQEKKTGVKRELAVSGVFIEIGLIPNSEFIRDLIDTNEAGEIIVEHVTGKTSKPGVFAAGDVTNDSFKTTSPRVMG